MKVSLLWNFGKNLVAFTTNLQLRQSPIYKQRWNYLPSRKAMTGTKTLLSPWELLTNWAHELRYWVTLTKLESHFGPCQLLLTHWQWRLLWQANHLTRLVPSLQTPSIERNWRPEITLTCLLIFLIYRILRVKRLYGSTHLRGGYRGRGFQLRGKGFNNRTSRTCHYRGKGRRFITFCRFRINDATEGRIRKPNQRPTNNMAKTVEQYQDSSFGPRNQHTTQPGPNASNAQDHPAQNVPPLGALRDPFVCMAYIFDIA